MKFITVTSLLSLVFVLTGCKPAIVNQISLLDSGIAEAEFVQSRIVSGVPGTRIRSVTGTRILDKSNRVPARKGVKFGIQYVLEGSPRGRIVYVTNSATHPPITDPDTGITHKGISYQERAIIGNTSHPSYFGFDFDYDWELAPGEWVLRVEYEGKLLEKKFIVYKP